LLGYGQEITIRKILLTRRVVKRKIIANTQTKLSLDPEKARRYHWEGKLGEKDVCTTVESFAPSNDTGNLPLL